MLFSNKTLKQYGLPRSGSNYTKWMIENNYFAKVEVNIGGWKHGPHMSSTKKSFCTIKNPYSWCVSIYNFVLRNFMQKKWSPFETKSELGLRSIKYFIAEEFTIKSDKETYFFENPIAYWNFAIKNWNEGGSKIIRYEDLLDDPHKSLCSLDIKRKKQIFELDCVALPGMEKTILDKKTRFDHEFYIKKEYMKELDKECIDLININVDKDLAYEVKYEII